MPKVLTSPVSFDVLICRKEFELATVKVVSHLQRLRFGHWWGGFYAVLVRQFLPAFYKVPDILGPNSFSVAKYSIAA